MGGGQLGRMFVHAAQRLGYRTAVLDPDPLSPAGLVAHDHIRTGYLDPAGARRARRVLRRDHDRVRERAGRRAAPAGRGARRSRRRRAGGGGVPGPRRREGALRALRRALRAARGDRRATRDVDAVADADLLPGILKTARLGYDGKGQVRVADAGRPRAAHSPTLGSVPCVLEKTLPLAAEISVDRRPRRATATSSTCRCSDNLHRAGILAVTHGPGARRRRDAPAEATAIDAARRIAASLDYVGVLCVEFFVLRDGTLVANEMAPRPHNSGHYSIDACDVSQFELQVRALTGAPLVAPRLHSPCVMLNLLGDLWRDRPRRRAGLAPPCSRCPVPTCTCTARQRRAPAARWAT